MSLNFNTKEVIVIYKAIKLLDFECHEKRRTEGEFPKEKKYVDTVAEKLKAQIIRN